MADENQTGAAPAASVTAPAVDAAAQTKPSGSDEPLWNKQEVVELKKDVREFRKLLGEIGPALNGLRTQPPATETKPAEKSKEPPAVDGDMSQRLANLERENVLVRAYAAHGVKPGPLQDAIEKAAKYMPPSELAGLVESFVKAAPATDKQTTNAGETAQAPPPAGVSDSGPPGVSPTTSLSLNPNKIPAGILSAMTSEERQKRVNAWLATGTSSNWTRGTGKRPA